MRGVVVDAVGGDAENHRIRLEISSSNFPRFDRNLNTGNPIGDDDQPRIATNRIYHDTTTHRTSCCR